AIKRCCTLIFPVARNADTIPAGRFVIVIEPPRRFAHPFVLLHHFSLLLTKSSLCTDETIDVCSILILPDATGHIRKFSKPLVTNPGFCRCATYACVDNANGHFIFFMKCFCKKVCNN